MLTLLTDNAPNNREWATLFWLGLVLAWLLWRSDMRLSLLGVARAAASPWIWGPFLALLLWTAGMVAVGSRLRLWSSDLLKDTVVWAVGPAVASYLNVSNIERRPRFFRRAALGAVKYSVFVEFYVNLYVFNFLVELVLVPLITMLALLSFVAGREKRTRIVKQVFDLVLGLIGIGLVVFVTVNVIVGWRQVDRLHDLRELLLPIWLTIGVLLFLYGLSLYSNYQQAFLRLKFATSDRRAVRRGKFALASVLHFRTRAVSSFAWPWLGQLAAAESLGDARRIVKDFARRDHLLNDKSDESTQNAVDGNGDGNADEP